jgi:hypothetical protein
VKLVPASHDGCELHRRSRLVGGGHYHERKGLVGKWQIDSDEAGF